MLAVRLSDANGLEKDAPVVTRGLEVGSVATLRVEGEEVKVEARLAKGQDPSFGADACARVIDGRLVLEPGEAETEVPEVIPGCDMASGDEPDPWPGMEHPDLTQAKKDDPELAEEIERDPDLAEAIRAELELQDEIEAARKAKANKKGEPKTKAKGKKAKPSCGKDLSFSTLSVVDVAPIPLHLPDGGWRAKIKWENTGSHYVDIDPVSRAVFMDEDGAALDIATLPGSRDWFMGFSIPPGGTKTVTVTFFKDGGAKPFVETIRYDFVCA